MKEKVLLIYEEKAESGGFARSFGIQEIEIDDAILKKHGKVLSKSEPDIFPSFLRSVERKARELFGI
jgi:hypothetical protein